MRELIAGLLHEAEHAQHAVQRTAALQCLQAGPLATPAPLPKWMTSAEIGSLHGPWQKVHRACA